MSSKKQQETVAAAKQEQVETSQAATFVEPVKVTPESKKGSSTIKYPVARIWVLCLNLTAANKDGELLPRSKYIKEAISMGAAYYTARTQVDRYIRWVNGDSSIKVPRGVQIKV